jgi:hypothetical protein
MKNKDLLVLGIAGFIGAAAGLSIARKKRNSQPGDKPPKGAPQVKISNPGDQSEFPAAPESERDLG